MWLVYDNAGKAGFSDYSNSGKTDRHDLNQNDDTEEKLLNLRCVAWFSSAFKVLGSTDSSKDANYKFDNKVKEYELGEEYRLGLSVENKTGKAVKSMKLIDVLPRVGDTLQISEKSRNNGTNLYLTGPVAVEKTQNDTDNREFEILYSTDKAGNLDANLKANFVEAEQISNWNEVTMFQVKLKSGEISNENKAIFSAPVKSDIKNTKENQDGNIYAGNNFAYSASNELQDLNDADSFVDTIINYDKLKIVKYNVTFEMNGHGVTPDKQEVIKGEKATKPKDPKAENYSFAGWYADSNFETEFDFENSVINEDTVIYAKWLAIKDISYEFVSGTENKDLPQAIKDRLKNIDKTEKSIVGSEINAPAKDDTNYQSLEDDNKEGSWTFKAWTPEKLTVSDENDSNKFVGTWIWTKKEYTKDKIIPFIPDDNNPDKEPDKGSDDKDIPKNYITVTFKSEDAAKGKVKVGTKEGVEVKAKVAPDTDLATAKDIMPVPAADYGFTKWDPKLGVAKAGNIYTAYFIKSGSEIKENDPIPEGWLKVTVKQEAESIKENTVEEKTYAVKPNDKLAEDKFPNLENSAKDGYEKPAWYKDMDKAPTTAPWDIEITKDTSFIAKAEAAKVTPTPEPTPEPTPTPEPEPQPTPTPEPTPSPDPKAEKVKITFKVNKGKWSDGSTEDKVLVVDKGTVIDIIKAPEREGYEFLYWKGSEYQPGEKYTAVEDHTFVAQWKKAAVVNPEPTPEEPSQSSKPAESSKVEKPTTSASKPTENKVTKTGEASYITMTTGLISIAIAGVLVLNRKKNEE